MSELIDELKNEFRDEEYRYAFDEDFANARMAMQIKVIREEQEMTQAKLAELVGMKQTRISALENINYSSWSVSTLRRLAKGLGVRFSFKFESWGNLLYEADSVSHESLNRPKFEEDPKFKDTETHEVEPEQITVGQERLATTLTVEAAATVSGLDLDLSDKAVSDEGECFWKDHLDSLPSTNTVEASPQTDGKLIDFRQRIIPPHIKPAPAWEETNPERQPVLLFKRTG